MLYYQFLVGIVHEENGRHGEAFTHQSSKSEQSLISELDDGEENRKQLNIALVS